MKQVEIKTILFGWINAVICSFTTPTITANTNRYLLRACFMKNKRLSKMIMK